MNKNKGFIYREIDTGESKIRFNKDYKKGDCQLKILDKSGKEINEYDYISPTDGTAVITLKFR